MPDLTRDEMLRLAAVAITESDGVPMVCDWQEAAIKVCRALLAARMQPAEQQPVLWRYELFREIDEEPMVKYSPSRLPDIWGRPGVDYDPTYRVVETPLYPQPPAAADSAIPYDCTDEMPSHAELAALVDRLRTAEWPQAYDPKLAADAIKAAWVIAALLDGRRAAADSAQAEPHPCARGCQYAQDVGMPGHSCGHGCVYERTDKLMAAEDERDEIAALRHALENCRLLAARMQPAEQQTGWRRWPETSPPSGAPVLSYRDGEPWVSMSRFIGGADGTEWADMEGRTTVTHSTFLPPTHWMPLPHPPAAADSAQPERDIQGICRILESMGPSGQANANVLRRIVGERDAEIGTLRHQMDMLAQAIGESAVRAGVCHSNVALTGPHLLMMLDDLATLAQGKEADHGPR